MCDTPDITYSLTQKKQGSKWVFTRAVVDSVTTITIFRLSTGHYGCVDRIGLWGHVIALLSRLSRPQRSDSRQTSVSCDNSSSFHQKLGKVRNALATDTSDWYQRLIPADTRLIPAWKLGKTRKLGKFWSLKTESRFKVWIWKMDKSKKGPHSGRGLIS